MIATLERTQTTGTRPRPISQLVNGAQTAPPTANEIDRQPAHARPGERVRLDQLDTGHPRIAAAVQMARDWGKRKQEGFSEASLVLCGSNGCGKTHIAMSVLWAMCYTLDDGTAVSPVGRYFLSNDLLSALGSAPNEYGYSQMVRVTDVIGNAPVVVIDDIGSEQQIPFIGKEPELQTAEREARLFRVIDYCYIYKISLVLVSNKPLADLKKILGPRSWSRLQEMAPAGFMMELWEADGRDLPDWRVKAGGR
jgi:DNA replication protein DnaC